MWDLTFWVGLGRGANSRCALREFCRTATPNMVLTSVLDFFLADRQRMRHPERSRENKPRRNVCRLDSWDFYTKWKGLEGVWQNARIAQTKQIDHGDVFGDFLWNRVCKVQYWPWNEPHPTVLHFQASCRREVGQIHLHVIRSQITFWHQNIRYV